MKRKSQEEMVGFALIVIVVAVVILIFLGLAIRRPDRETVQNYEAESFLQSALQYTTDCRDNLEYLTVQKLIFRCNREEACLDERRTCEVLEGVLQEIVQESWKIENRPLEGYEFKIVAEEDELLSLSGGNKTNNYKSALQDFSKGGSSFTLNFRVYS